MGAPPTPIKPVQEPVSPERISPANTSPLITPPEKHETLRPPVLLSQQSKSKKSGNSLEKPTEIESLSPDNQQKIMQLYDRYQAELDKISIAHEDIKKVRNKNLDTVHPSQLEGLKTEYKAHDQQLDGHLANVKIDLQNKLEVYADQIKEHDKRSKPSAKA